MTRNFPSLIYDRLYFVHLNDPIRNYFFFLIVERIDLKVIGYFQGEILYFNKSVIGNIVFYIEGKTYELTIIIGKTYC